MSKLIMNSADIFPTTEIFRPLIIVQTDHKYICGIEHDIFATFYHQLNNNENVGITPETLFESEKFGCRCNHPDCQHPAAFHLKTLIVQLRNIDNLSEDEIIKLNKDYSNLIKPLIESYDIDGALFIQSLADLPQFPNTEEHDFSEIINVLPIISN